MKCAAYVINRMPLSPTNMKSPYELMFREKPSVKHLRVFGSICYVHVPECREASSMQRWENAFLSLEVYGSQNSTLYCFKGCNLWWDSTILRRSGEKQSDGGRSDKFTHHQYPIIFKWWAKWKRDSIHRSWSWATRRDDSQISQRPKRNTVKPAGHRDENFISTYSCCFAGLIDEDEPATFEEAK